MNLREKKGANWNQENVLEYFFWIIWWPRTENIITYFSNFFAGQKELNQKRDQYELDYFKVFT